MKNLLTALEPLWVLIGAPFAPLIVIIVLIVFVLCNLDWLKGE